MPTLRQCGQAQSCLHKSRQSVAAMVMETGAYFAVGAGPMQSSLMRSHTGQTVRAHKLSGNAGFRVDLKATALAARMVCVLLSRAGMRKYGDAEAVLKLCTDTPHAEPAFLPSCRFNWPAFPALWGRSLECS